MGLYSADYLYFRSDAIYHLARILGEIGNPSGYAVVFEKTSAFMVNQDRINVWEESTVDDVNAVQTARNN